MTNSKLTYNVLRFRRFSRKGFAAFVSMHKVVTIGHLSGRITDLQVLKSGRAFLLGNARLMQRLTMSAEDWEKDDALSLTPALTESMMVAATRVEVAAAVSLEVLNNCLICHRSDIVATMAFFYSYIMKKKCIFFALIGLSIVAYGQDTLNHRKTIREVTVTQARPSADVEHLHVVQVIDAERIASIPAHTVGELLEQLPGIDLRNRGVDGTQADLSMRGGTFDQVLVLLNGVNITDPHTGHYNMDLPIDLSLVDRIEMLQGTALSSFGLSAFCGAINIVTGSGDSPQATVGLAGGSYATAKLYAGGQKRVGQWMLSGAGSLNRSDGYIRNTDYGYGNIFLQARQKAANGDGWNIQMGLQHKNYGANGFYSLTYKDQYEQTRTLLASVSRSRHLGNFLLDYSAFGRWHYDCFQLFRDCTPDIPSWYHGHNYHISDVEGANAKIALPWAWGRTTAGIEVRHEHINSNVLGDATGDSLPVPFAPEGTYFLYEKGRTNVNYFVEHQMVGARYSVAAGLSGNHNTMFGNGACFSVVGTYQLSPQFQLFGSVGRSLRLPTFTDLYYHSVNQMANPDLKPEESLNGELSLHWNRGPWYARTTVYCRQGKNVIDWIRMNEETVWRSANHTKVDALGTELQLGYRGKGFLQRAEMGFAYCLLSKEAGDFKSEYALDYLRNKLSAQVSVAPVRKWTIDLAFSHQQRKGLYQNAMGEMERYKAVWLLDARMGYQIRWAKIYLEGRNLLNQTYFDYGGLMQPGAHCLAGIECRF